MCYLDGDAASVWRENTRRARKQHRCIECHGPVPVGASYIRVTYFSEGWDSTAIHLECMALWRWAHAELCRGHGLIELGGLHEELREYDLQVFDTDDEGEIVSPALTLNDLLVAIRDGYQARTEVTT